MKHLAWMLVAAVLAGCGESSSSGAGPAPGGKKKYRFAIVPKMQNNKVFRCADISARAAAKEIGAKENCEIEILFQGPPGSDPPKQASIVEALASQGVQGISVSVDDVNVLKGAIDAASAKVPVVTFDSDSPESKRKFFFGTNDIECGERLAKHLGNLIQKGKVVIQSGTTGAPNLQLRVKGAKDYLAKHHPDIKVEDVLYCNDDVKKAVDQIGSYMSAHSDIAGWILVGGWALFGEGALNAIDPAKTKVVSCDALPEEWAYLESGKCQMLLAQDLWGWGAQSVRILKDLVDGKEVKAGPGGIINGGLEEVTPDTLADFKKRWALQFPDYK